MFFEKLKNKIAVMQYHTQLGPAMRVSKSVLRLLIFFQMFQKDFRLIKVKIRNF